MIACARKEEDEWCIAMKNSTHALLPAFLTLRANENSEILTSAQFSDKSLVYKKYRPAGSRVWTLM